MLLLFLSIPIVGFLLMLLAARTFARAAAPDVPRNGTAGPWCLSCRYSLAGIAEGTSCPECGRSKRYAHPSPSPHAAAWILLSFLASLLSHFPYLSARLAHKSIPPFLYAAPIAEAFFVAFAMLLLASRMRGRPLLCALLAMTIPQTIIDAIALRLMHATFQPSVSFFTILIWYGLLSNLAVPATFILYALIGTVRARRSRRR